MALLCHKDRQIHQQFIIRWKWTSAIVLTQDWKAQVNCTSSTDPHVTYHHSTTPAPPQQLFGEGVPNNKLKEKEKVTP